jgi:hypothetical protein
MNTNNELNELRAEALEWMRLLHEWMAVTDERLCALEKAMAEEPS